MTTKPKARKFRLRRGGSASGPEQPPKAGSEVPPNASPEESPAPSAEGSRAPVQPDNLFRAEEDGFGEQDFKAEADKRPAPSQAQPEGPVRPARPQRGIAAEHLKKARQRPVAQIVRKAAPATSQEQSHSSEQPQGAALQNDGFTGRQLRIARRVAQRNGLNPTSDMEAIRLLRQKGIDPFARENMLQLVPRKDDELTEDTPQDSATGQPDKGGTQLPQPAIKGNVSAPSPVMMQAGLSPEAEVAKEVRKIRFDIVRRRRKRGALLMIRLMFFVFLPTFLAGVYYFKIATPMFATNSQFVIQQADSQSAAGGLGGLFSGTALGTSQDAITVQSYLQSRDAMLRLNKDLGFKAHFSSDAIDRLQRLEADASNEDAYRVFQKHVKIGFDATEGLIRMEVIAADPATSQAFSEALINYAEEQVDHLTQRLREDQMAGARESYQNTEQRMLEAQQRVVSLQEQRGVLSAEAEASSLMGQISTFEVDLQVERLRLQELQQNSNPNRSRVAVIRGNIARLEQTVADLRSRMTDEGIGGSASLARISGELMVAQQDLQTRTLMLQQSLQQLETARIEANRQVRYLSMGVAPIAPDEATYPRSLENTILAFMIFGGIYLMMSLTASILREQVSG